MATEHDSDTPEELDPSPFDENVHENVEDQGGNAQREKLAFGKMRLRQLTNDTFNFKAEESAVEEIQTQIDAMWNLKDKSTFQNNFKGFCNGDHGNEEVFTLDVELCSELGHDPIKGANKEMLAAIKSPECADYIPTFVAALQSGQTVDPIRGSRGGVRIRPGRPVAPQRVEVTFKQKELELFEESNLDKPSFSIEEGKYIFETAAEALSAIRIVGAQMARKKHVAWIPQVKDWPVSYATLIGFTTSQHAEFCQIARDSFINRKKETQFHATQRVGRNKERLRGLIEHGESRLEYLRGKRKEAMTNSIQRWKEELEKVILKASQPTFRRGVKRPSHAAGEAQVSYAGFAMYLMSAVHAKVNCSLGLFQDACGVIGNEIQMMTNKTFKSSIDDPPADSLEVELAIYQILQDEDVITYNANINEKNTKGTIHRWVNTIVLLGHKIVEKSKFFVTLCPKTKVPQRIDQLYERERQLISAVKIVKREEFGQTILGICTSGWKAHHEMLGRSNGFLINQACPTLRMIVNAIKNDYEECEPLFGYNPIMKTTGFEDEHSSEEDENDIDDDSGKTTNVDDLRKQQESITDAQLEEYFGPTVEDERDGDPNKVKTSVKSQKDEKKSKSVSPTQSTKTSAGLSGKKEGLSIIAMGPRVSKPAPLTDNDFVTIMVKNQFELTTDIGHVREAWSRRVLHHVVRTLVKTQNSMDLIKDDIGDILDAFTSQEPGSLSFDIVDKEYSVVMKECFKSTTKDDLVQAAVLTKPKTKKEDVSFTVYWSVSTQTRMQDLKSIGWRNTPGDAKSGYTITGSGFAAAAYVLFVYKFCVDLIHESSV